MCGIAGTVNWGDEECLESMARALRHRGPDDGGVLYWRSTDESQFGLASRRLAILDLSPAGHMPMQNEDGSVAITFNGEIYNFRDLRRRLEQRGCRFRSQTDTEVVLRLYEQEGPACLQQMRGMFAFAVLDKRGAAPSLFLARDHFGIKPLYYVHRGRKFAFASEVKAFLRLPGYKPELNSSALDSYLTFLWVPDPETMFAGIQKLEAGHCATLRDGRLKIECYWDLRFPPTNASYSHTEEELIEAVHHHLSRAVREQRVSDVPLGAFLSAGLDSTSIAAFLSSETERPLNTYTITYPQKYLVGESTIDDPKVASRVAAKLGCKHHEIVVEPDVAELLPALTWHLDEPVADPAAIACYVVCRAARQDVTVLLSGIGGDEIFGGYRKYSAYYLMQAYQRIPAWIRSGLEQGLNCVPNLRGSRWKGTLRLARKMIRNTSLSAPEAFLMSSTYLNDAERRQLCLTSIEDEHPWSRHQSHFERVNDSDFLNQMLYVDSKTFMISLNLTYNDKMSMASSVEVRVPFLDRELAEFVAWHVPPRLKLKPGIAPVTKYILRRAMKRMLPNEVFQQPKAGFFAPIDYWLAFDLREIVDELLSERQVRARGLFRPEAVWKMVEQHRRGVRDWSMQIWQLLSLEMWMRTFLDGDHAVLPSSASAASKAEVIRE